MDHATRHYTDHDLLIRINTLLDVMSADIATFKQTTNHEISRLWNEKGSKQESADHEKRLRALEKSLWKAAGAITVIEVLIGLVIHYWK
jgi:hypothetical protein